MSEGSAQASTSALQGAGAYGAFDAEQAFLEHLKAIGRDACACWLAANLDHLGEQATIDLVETRL